MQQTFFELIKEENRKGATIFFSSHILSEVQKMCSRVAFIKEGRILKQEKMSTLQEDNYKKFNLEAKSLLTEGMFAQQGISKLEIKENTASFIFKGNLNSMIKQIAELDLRNISIEEPDLEEIFLHYYAREEGSL